MNEWKSCACYHRMGNENFPDFVFQFEYKYLYIFSTAPYIFYKIGIVSVSVCLCVCFILCMERGREISPPKHINRNEYPENWWRYIYKSCVQHYLYKYNVKIPCYEKKSPLFSPQFFTLRCKYQENHLESKIHRSVWAKNIWYHRL